MRWFDATDIWHHLSGSVDTETTRLMTEYILRYRLRCHVLRTFSRYA